MDYLSGFLKYKPESIVKLVDYLKKDKSKSEIISIGSGTGYFEYQLQKNMADRKIICVDPEYRSYAREHPIEKMLPDYPTIEEVEKDGKNIGESIVILNWPSPDTHIDQVTNKSEKKYDFDAIVKYKPKMFMVSYDKKGASGSTKLISLLNNEYSKENVIENLLNNKKNEQKLCGQIKIDDVNYDVVFSKYILGHTFDLEKGSNTLKTQQMFVLILYIREDHKNNYDLDEIEYGLTTIDNMLINYTTRTYNFF